MIFVRGNWFFIALSLLTALFMARSYLYVAQQDNYRPFEIFKNKRLRRAYLTDILTVLVFGGAFVGFSFLKSGVVWGFFSVMFFLVAEITLYFVEEIPDKKKPMRYTKRAVRALISLTLAGGIGATLAIMHSNAVISVPYFRYAVIFALPLLFPLLFCTVMSGVNLLERLNNLRYEGKTKRTLSERPDLIKIAVAGSYGKTSVKNYLAAMLEGKYKVLATPESYNTPMGIAKTVAKLDASHEVFIAETGGRRVGDIKRLMKLVRPRVGLLTGINTQHIATFGSFESIKREKLRVLSMLPYDGLSFASDRTREYVEEAVAKKPFRLPVYSGCQDNSEVKVSSVAVCGSGSVFNLEINGEVYAVSTKLLGVHNAENLALAAAAALSLGVSPEEIVRVIARIEPVPHRLQLINGNGIRIIDDSFNSNPDGARCAIEVLSAFSGRKIALTPGLVELGETEREENRRLGAELAAACDMVILIGEERTEPIRAGLKDGKFAGEIKVFPSLAEAQAEFKNLLHLGDVLLLLNDLPDIYGE